MQTLQSEDEVLVRQAQGGDIGAFTQLVERYQTAIYGLAFHFVRNFADAQDLAQDTFIAAYEGIERVREPARFAGWLRSIVYNQWLMRRRAAGARWLEVSVDDESYTNFVHKLSDPSPTPDEVILQDERTRTVMQAIGSLPETTQLVTTLYYLHDLSYREIASLLDLSESTIRSRLQRARQKLKEEMITMAQDLFDEHRLTPDFARRIIGRIHSFGFSGIDSGNLSKVFPDEKARALYLSLYPTGQYDIASNLGYSQEEYTQIMELWEDVKIIKREDTKVIAQIPIYIAEDMRHCSPWVDDAVEATAQAINAHGDEYEKLAATFSHGNASMQQSLMGILLIFYTLDGIGTALEAQHSLSLSVPERAGLGSFTLAAYGDNAEGKHLSNIGTNGYQQPGGVFYMFHSEGKARHKERWQFTDDWLSQDFSMIELLIRMRAEPQTREMAIQTAIKLGFRREFASIALDDLIKLGFLSSESPHQLLIPCLDVGDIEQAESLGHQVAAEAVVAMGNPETQLAKVIQKCSFAQCNFADVFNMLFLELRGAIIEELIQRGLLTPSQANNEWGCWIEVRNDAIY